MKTSPHMKTGMKIALGVGAALGATALLGALVIRRTNARKNRALQETVAQEDAEDKARFDGEGGSMQPVEVHV